MAALKEMKCEACRKGAPTVTEDEMRDLLPHVPEWAVGEEGGVPRLVRVFEFPDFSEALAFTNRVGAIAEAEGHHPALLTEWGRVTVSWWTHKIRGLHRNDFIMAAKTDEVLAAQR
jgi:4a-hydroxytetrahydrobiopterin dehydratase